MLAPLTSRAALALLSPSARVLAASALPGDGVHLARSLPWSDVHWPTLVSLTSFERAEAQIYRLLRAAPDGAVPDAVQRSVQAMYRVALFRAAELAEAAGTAADALQHAGVEVLWLKGAALAMQSVEGFTLRSMGDLDLLVEERQLAAARDALFQAGWTAGVMPETYRTHHHEAPMVWRGALRLELHTGLFSPGHPFAADAAATWVGRGRQTEWGGRRVRVLPPEWHLVHASTHWAWSHEGSVGTWQYLHDAHWIASAWPSAGPEWRAVVSHAAEVGATLPVRWGAWSAARLGELPGAEPTIAALSGAAGAAGGFTEREWVLRAFHSPMASPSVRWSRYWWRRAMAGLGSAERAWPWALGRTIGDDAADVEGGAAGGLMIWLRRWHRHLGRVLRS